MDAGNTGKHNMGRLRFGLDAELNPYQLALAQQTNDHNLKEKTCQYMLSLNYKRADGSLRAAGSAFYIMHGERLAVTAAHVTTPDGSADQIVACYSDGQQSDVLILAEDRMADLSVFKVDATCPLPCVRHAAANVGDTVYVLGFSAGNKLNFTKGMVTSTEVATFTTDACADNGFSGGPVFNLHMELVGMVLSGAGIAHGITSQQVRCINVSWVEGFVSGIMAAVPTYNSWP